MHDWTLDLGAFVNNTKGYDYGTRNKDDFKLMTPEGTIEIAKDSRWGELLALMDVFSGSSAE